jgi:C_GCAxxG_C_C family probable redox protein
VSKIEQAAALHAAGSSCSQAVFTAFAPDYGLDPRIAHRLSTGLGAGFGRQQRLCGAISGAALVLGLAKGSADGSQAEAKEATYEAVFQFIEEIKAEFGGADCRDLLEGLDLRNPADRAAYKERNLSVRVCDRIIKRCVELLEAKLGPTGRS